MNSENEIFNNKPEVLKEVSSVVADQRRQYLEGRIPSLATYDGLKLLNDWGWDLLVVRIKAGKAGATKEEIKKAVEFGRIVAKVMVRN